MNFLIATLIALFSVNCFANDSSVAACESPISGDPSFRAYIYVDVDGQTKADIWQKTNENHPVSLKGACYAPAANFSPTPGISTMSSLRNEQLLECIGAVGVNGKAYSFLSLGADGQLRVSFFISFSSDKQPFVGSQLLCE